MQASPFLQPVSSHAQLLPAATPAAAPPTPLQLDNPAQRYVSVSALDTQAAVPLLAPSPAAAAAGPPLAAAPSARVALQETEVDGVKFCVGDSAYVVMDPDSYDYDQAEEEACTICQSTAQSAGNVLLECSACLGAWHQKCAAVAVVPGGDWFCAGCTQGTAPPLRTSTTACARYLSGRGEIELCRIEGMWRSLDSEDVISLEARWYILPQQTLGGRKAGHNAREVMLTQQVDTNWLGVLLRPCDMFCSLSRFRCAAGLGDDVFLCRRGYDTHHNKFVKLEQQTFPFAGGLGEARQGSASTFVNHFRRPASLGNVPGQLLPALQACMQPLQVLTSSLPGGILKRTFMLAGGGYFGVVQYDGVFSAEELTEMEEQVRHLRHHRDQFKAETFDVSGELRCKRIKAMFGARYVDYGAEQKPKIKRDVDPIPAWLRQAAALIDSRLPGLLPHPDLVGMAVVNMYTGAGARLGAHVDSADLFQRPIVSLRLFADSALSFGYKMGRCRVNATRSHRLDVGRGTVMTLEGPAGNLLQHCVCDVDTCGLSASVMLRVLQPQHCS